MNAVEIVVGAILAGLVGYFGWLFKESLYGKLKDIQNMIQAKQDSSSCVIHREACQTKVELRLDSIYGKIHDKVFLIDAKLEHMSKQVDSLISKIERHIEKESR